MIPIRSAVPTRYPPLVTWMLIAANCAVCLIQVNLSTEELDLFLFRFALIPARYLDPLGQKLSKRRIAIATNEEIQT